MIHCDFLKETLDFTAEKHLTHPYGQAVLMLSGVEDQTNPTCPGKGDVSRGCFCVWEHFRRCAGLAAGREGVGSLGLCSGQVRAKAAELRKRREADGRRVLARLCQRVHAPLAVLPRVRWELGLGPGGSVRLEPAGAEPGTEHFGWLPRAPYLGGYCLALFDAARFCTHSSDLRLRAVYF